MKARVFDVARYILEKKGGMTAMKLQKLVYYAQCWSLVWDEKPLFDADIQAWRNGLVCLALYEAHRGKFKVEALDIEGDGNRLDDDARQTIDAVLDFYASHSAQWLSDLSHLEDPWILARRRAGAAPTDNCEEVITCADMHEYYCGIWPADDQSASIRAESDPESLAGIENKRTRTEKKKPPVCKPHRRIDKNERNEGSNPRQNESPANKPTPAASCR
ncbi:MAG: DUF4065 domain-containing protein [Ectothiorhodospiraceae bacterium AqS1]|nr:DUF4065 domain-containing protein [Ectothiorhodospiraceae bacterium AqS1]